MVQSLKKKTIFIVFDALPFEQFKNYAHIYAPKMNIEKFIKLESLIGYSGGIYPSIWTGLYPDNINCWTNFKYDPNMNLIKTDKTQKFNKVLALLRYLPRILTQFISLGLFLLSFKYNLFPYKYPVYFDFKLVKYFKFEDYHNFLFSPNKKDHSTLFSILRNNKVSFKYIETTNLSIDFIKFNEDIIFYCNPILDIVGHKYGPNSKSYNKILKKIINWIENLISESNYKIVLFSDHGMTTVNKKIYPLKILKKLGLKLYRDILVWLDSTMVRIWFNSKRSIEMKSIIIETFNNQKGGHLLTDQEKNQFGLNFRNRFYGDLIFIANPHYEIFPNFFNIIPFKFSKGLHGFIPTHKSSYGVFYSNFINYQEPLKLIDLYPIFTRELLLKNN